MPFLKYKIQQVCSLMPCLLKLILALAFRISYQTIKSFSAFIEPSTHFQLHSWFHLKFNVQQRKKRAEVVVKWTGFDARATAMRTLLCEQIG
jgi:hypothetical protein